MDAGRDKARRGHDVRNGATLRAERSLQREFQRPGPMNDVIGRAVSISRACGFRLHRNACQPWCVRTPTPSSERIMKNNPNPIPVRLGVRVDDANPLHHLWNNHGTWWCHLTVHRPDGTSERVRLSLKTRDREDARAKRDKIFGRLAAAETSVAG